MPLATPETEAKARAVYSVILPAGVPELDAKLIAGCVQHDRCASWMNTDEPKAGSVDMANATFVKEGLNLKVECQFYARGGKYMWEVKRRQ